jgi:hypothetical protein
MTDNEQRRAALELALLLPPHRADAMRVLDLLNGLVGAFLWEPISEPQSQPMPPRVRRVDFGAGT